MKLFEEKTLTYKQEIWRLKNKDGKDLTNELALQTSLEQKY